MMRKVQVPIDAVTFKGYGVARIHGKVVFVPYTVMGDEAWVEVTEEKKRYSSGRLIQLIESSPRRVNPPCPYFGSCGGCQWQHINYMAQPELKKEILRDLLKRLGRLQEIPSIGVFPSPKPYDYRIRIQLKVRGKAMGYYREGSHQIVDIDHCPISHPLVNRIIRRLRGEFALFRLMKEIEINVSPEEGRGMILFHPHSHNRQIEPFAKRLLQSEPILRGIAIAGKGKLALFGDSLEFTVPSYQDRNLNLRVSPGSFSQVNPEQNQRLIQIVLQFSEAINEDSILDLYAGVGNLTLPLAMGAKEVLGIEENRTAVEDAQFNAERNGIQNCHFIQGRAEHVLSNWERETPSLVVLDPPRTGCKTILDQVVRLKPRKIIYVSCEPTTFARDLCLFSERGYLLQKLSLIDMFPQTYHMEVVGLLTQPQVKV
ncbi:MAG: 23S rRNA (uracil(1939)-C(5))-methyltransferase RlmD [bacterium]